MIGKPIGHKLGWVPDTPDPRDVAFVPAKLGLLTKAPLPAKVDLRSQFPVPSYDQGQIGSCVANATVGALEYIIWQHHKMHVELSRLFLYYDTRSEEGTTAQDAGCLIRDAIKVGASQGICGEWAWPYKTDKYTDMPPKFSYTNAHTHLFSTYYSINDTTRGLDCKTALAGGFPVIFGFTVYQSFENDAVASTGVVPMPAPGEASLGGHAVLMMGYDDSKHAYLVRNSWGPAWGDGGYFWLPYAYANDPAQANDFWVIEAATGSVFADAK